MLVPIVGPEGVSQFAVIDKFHCQSHVFPLLLRSVMLTIDWLGIISLLTALPSVPVSFRGCTGGSLRVLSCVNYTPLAGCNANVSSC